MEREVGFVLGSVWIAEWVNRWAYWALGEGARRSLGWCRRSHVIGPTTRGGRTWAECNKDWVGMGGVRKSGCLDLGSQVASSWPQDITLVDDLVFPLHLARLGHHLCQCSRVKHPHLRLNFVY